MPSSLFCNAVSPALIWTGGLRSLTLHAGEVAEGEAMDEAEWLGCTEPQPMLEFLGGKASERKLRLFARHCFYRLHPHGISEEAFFAVDFTELFADGGTTAEELASARAFGLDHLDNYGFTASAVFEAFSCVTAASAVEIVGCAGHVIEALAYMGFEAAELQAELANQCQFLHDLFGPLLFRSVSLDPAWRTPTVTAAARAVYEKRILPVGTLDLDRLAVLADALEDAGCDNADILAHLRGPGQHVRGCWVIDLLLGKE
jgi:hypothetical protein